MLSQKYPPNKLRLATYNPYPRELWAKLPDTTRQALIQAGESVLDYAWKPLLATRFLEYARIGNRENYEQENFERRNVLIALTLAECAERQGRFIDQIVNGVWLICEETYWGLPAHVGMQREGIGLPDASEPTVDLFAAETASTLAYIHNLLGDALDAVSPLIRWRIRDEITRRILIPNLTRDDWGWMGWKNDVRPNNWNPWVNSNWLLCVLLIETDQKKRGLAVAKIMRTLDRFIDAYPADGGCDEGPGYWLRAAGSMFDCLELLYQATNGQIDVSDELLIQEMGRFCYRAHIDGEYYLNFADASAVTLMDSALVYRYGEYIRDADMMAFGAWLAQAQPKGESWGNPIHSPMRRLRTIFTTYAAILRAPKPPDVWLPEIQVMIARDDHFYVAAKGGHNNESHNHNDIGEFIVYVDGRPLLVDAGVETYSRKTFSPQRYEIWTMQSAFHNLPTIDDIQQSPGVEFAPRDVKYRAAADQASLSLDIAHAYPRVIKTWKRTIQLQRGKSIIVEDNFQLNHTPQKLTLSLLTPSEVNTETPGILRLTSTDLPNRRTSATGTIRYDAAQLTPSIEPIAITDSRMSRVWGNRLYRILLTAVPPKQHDLWRLEIVHT